jgi:hypothetical protein
MADGIIGFGSFLDGKPRPWAGSFISLKILTDLADEKAWYKKCVGPEF